MPVLRPAHARSAYVDVADIAEFVPAPNRNPFGPAPEFHRWMTFLDARKRATMEMRFEEEWEYHEIAAAQAVRRRNARFAGLVHAAPRNQAAIDDAILQLSRTVASRKNESEVALSLQLT